MFVSLLRAALRERFSFQSLSKSRRRRRVVVYDSVPGRRLFILVQREKRERERGKEMTMKDFDFVSKKSIPEEGEECNDEDEEEELIDDIEQYVQIRPSLAHQNEAICRVTCPDKTGLGADLARTIFDFGLVVVKGDFATDGQWAFVLLTIYAPPSTHELQRSSKSSGGGKGSKNKTKKTKNKSDESSEDESDGDDDTATRNDDTTSRHRSDSGAENNSEKSTNPGEEEEENEEENEESDDDETEEEEEEEEKAVNWKLLQMRLENLCPKKLSIAKSGKESNGGRNSSVNESDRATNLQKGGGRHSRKSSSRLDEIINANNKNGGKSHLEDMNGDHRSHNHEDDTNRRRRSQVSSSSNNNNNSSRLMKQQQSYSDFHDYFDDDDEYYKPSTFILGVELDDRVGLLRDLTLTLWECALIVQRAHISTSPANTAVDLFYVMDTKDELPNEDRVQEIEMAVRSVVAHGNEVKVGLHQVPFYAQGDYITRAGWLDDFSISQVESASATEYPSCDVWVDNLMSERHTVFQMISRDRKGLLYDILRASKELKVQIYYAKVEMKSGGLCEIDLFCERMTNDENARYLCQKYKQNIERPVAVQITSKGIDDLATEMRVICPLDFTGVTRPRVLLDATEALRRLNVMVFKADIVIDPGFSEGEQGQHQQGDFMIHRIDGGGGAGGSDGLNQPGGANEGVKLKDQTTTTTSQGSSLRKSGSSKSVHRTLAREVHRFILTDERGMPISNVRDRKTVCDAVLKNLLGLRGANEYFPGMSEVSEGIDYYNASSDEYGDSDDDDDDNFDVGYYGVGRIGGARRANTSSSRRKKSNSSNVNNNNKEGGGGYIGSAIGFAKRLLLFQKK